MFLVESQRELTSRDVGTQTELQESLQSEEEEEKYILTDDERARRDAAIRERVEQCAHLTEEQRGKLLPLLLEFLDCFALNTSEFRLAKLPPFDVDVGDAKPIKTPLRRVSPMHRDEIIRQMRALVAQGLYRESDSPWSCAPLLVKKANGTWRMCSDLRGINKLCEGKVSAYPLPRMDDALESIGGSKYMSLFDAKQGYLQCPNTKRAEEILTMRTPDGGLWAPRGMPFGHVAAPAHWQMIAEQYIIPSSIRWKSACIYLDDALLYDTEFDKHLKHMRELLIRSRECRLQWRLAKCEFALPKIKYLGTMVSEKGQSPAPELIRKIREFPRPESKKELKSFLSLLSYYRRFFKNFAKESGELNEMTKLHVRFEWLEKHQKLFEKLRDKLTSDDVLAWPNWDKPFMLQVDASDFAIGAVLSQRDDDGVEHPIAFISRRLSERERNFDVREKECLGFVWALVKLRVYLIHRHFDVWTDHLPLKWLNSHKTPGRLSRWRLICSEFSYTMHYRKGAKNGNADAMSRIPLRAQDPPDLLVDTRETVEICVVKVQPDGEKKKRSFWNPDRDDIVNLPSVSEMRQAQRADPLLSRVIAVLLGTAPEVPSVTALFKGVGAYEIEPGSELLMYYRKDKPRMHRRIVVPERLQKILLKASHDIPISGHLGVQKTVQRLRERFYWRGLHEDTRAYVGGCIVCARKKPPAPKFQGLLASGWSAKRPFQWLEFDLLGPFPESTKGNKYIAVMVCRFTRYVEIVAIRDTSAAAAAEVFINEIVCRHGVPEILLTDRGSNFTSQLMARVAERLRCKKVHAMTAHAQTIGTAERLNRFITMAVYAYVDEEGTDWDDVLPSIAMAYRTSVVEAIGMTPAELVYGRRLRLPQDLLESKQSEDVVDQKEYNLRLLSRLRRYYNAALKSQAVYDDKKKVNYDNSHKETEFKVGDVVLIAAPKQNLHRSKSRKLSPVYSPPHKVVHRLSEWNYRVQSVETGKLYDVNIQRMLRFKPREGEMPEVKRSAMKRKTPRSVANKRHDRRRASTNGARPELAAEDPEDDPEAEDSSDLDVLSEPESEPELENDQLRVTKKFLRDDEWIAVVASDRGQHEMPWGEVPRELRTQYGRAQRSLRRKARG